MAKQIPLPLVTQALLDTVDETTAQKVLQKIVEANQKEDDGDDDKPPRVKKEFLIVLANPDGILPPDITGWVIQVDEGVPPPSVFERLGQAAAEYNTTRKGRHHPANTVPELFENVAAKFFKPTQISVKTKMPVWCLPAPDKLPKPVQSE